VPDKQELLPQPKVTDQRVAGRGSWVVRCGDIEFRGTTQQAVWHLGFVMQEVIRLRAERETLIAGVLAADWLMTPVTSSHYAVFDANFDAAHSALTAALNLAEEFSRQSADKEPKP